MSTPTVSLLAAWAALPTALLGPAPEPGPPLAEFAIEEVTSGGPGCADPGSVSALVSDDRRTLGLVFHAMTLDNPPGPPVKFTSCTAGVRLRIPAGWQVAPATVRARGHADLDAGVEARWATRYFFAGEPLGAVYRRELAGVHAGPFAFTELFPYDAPVWSACGGPAILALSADLVLDASAAPDAAALVEAEAQRLVTWRWRRC